MIAANPYLRLSYRNAGPRMLSGRMIRVLDQRPPLSAEDIRIHAWINERLATVSQERHGLWAKVCGVFSRSRPMA